MPKKEKDAIEKRLSEICAAINNGAFGGEGHDAVTYLGEEDIQSLERFSSGNIDLDEALGGGWPKGRFIEIFGPESGGKTTLVLHAIAEHQKKYPDEIVGLVDSEYSFDADYASKLGVNVSRLIVTQPTSGQQALNIMRQLIQHGVKCLVVDSVAALTTKEELEGDLGDAQVADQARMMSRALRTLTTEAGSRKATIFFTNQVREKIGIAYGEKTTTPAGRALKHYASIRVQVSRIGHVKEKIDGEDIIVSAKTKADVKKNKTAPPFRSAEFVISFGHGIDKEAAVLDKAIELGIVERRGSWLQRGEEQLGQGRAVVLQRMREDPKLTEELSNAIKQAEVSKRAEGKQAEQTSDGGVKAPFKMKRASFSKHLDKDVDRLDTPEESEGQEGGTEVTDA
jgi:recombination protein RecA